MRRVPRTLFLLALVLLVLPALIGCRGGHDGRHSQAHRHDRRTWETGSVRAASRAERRTLRDGPLFLHRHPPPRPRKACCNTTGY